MHFAQMKNRKLGGDVPTQTMSKNLPIIRGTRIDKAP